VGVVTYDDPVAPLIALHDPPEAVHRYHWYESVAEDGITFDTLDDTVSPLATTEG